MPAAEPRERKARPLHEPLQARDPYVGRGDPDGVLAAPETVQACELPLRPTVGLAPPVEIRLRIDLPQPRLHDAAFRIRASVNPPVSLRCGQKRAR